VKGINFTGLRDAGDPVELGRFYSNAGADELVFLDITASHENRNIVLEMVHQVATQLFIPFSVGGGIRQVEDFERMLTAGADKVCVNTAAVAMPTLIDEAAKAFGSQCVVVAIDVTAGGDDWIVLTHGGRKRSHRRLRDWLAEVADRGAGEILLTSFDRDGTKSGYDLSLLKVACDMVTIPIIASGGVGSIEHFVELFSQSDTDAALAASVFHYGELTIREVKQRLAKAGIAVRLT